MISGHYQTGEPLPATLRTQLINAKHFHLGLYLLRQIEFALFDFQLHCEFDPRIDNQIQRILNTVREEIAIMPVPEFNRFQHSFAHIFAGGYAAGYYSYLWADVLASDAFSLFLEQGVLNPETGQRFLQIILEQGGSRDPETLFTEFRGRSPSIAALLAQLKPNATTSD